MTTVPASINAEFARVDGYWTPDRLAIWASMTPDRRDYDRYQGWFPPGQGACETEDGTRAVEQRAEESCEAEHECRCHINPPCWHCSGCTECTKAGLEACGIGARCVTCTRPIGEGEAFAQIDGCGHRLCAVHQNDDHTCAVDHG